MDEDGRGVFLLPLPTGGYFSVWSKTLEIFFPLLLFGDGQSVLTNFREIFSSHLPTGEEFGIWAVFCKTFLFTSSPRNWKAVFQWKSYFFMKFLLSSLTWEKCQPPLPTGGEIAAWTENLEIFSLHSPPDMREPIFQRKSKMFLSSAYKRKNHLNRTLFRSKKSRSWFFSHYLATAEGLFCRGNRKMGKKISSHERLLKNCEQYCKSIEFLTEMWYNISSICRRRA